MHMSLQTVEVGYWLGLVTDWWCSFFFFCLVYTGSRTFSWYRGLSVTQVSVGDPSNLILFDQAGQGQNQFFKCVGALSVWGKWVFLLYVHPEKDTQHMVPQNSSRTLVTFLRFSKEEEALVIQPRLFICTAPYKAKTLSIIYLPEDCSYNYFVNIRREKINVVCCRAWNSDTSFQYKMPKPLKLYVTAF